MQEKNAIKSCQICQQLRVCLLQLIISVQEILAVVSMPSMDVCADAVIVSQHRLSEITVAAAL